MTLLFVPSRSVEFPLSSAAPHVEPAHPPLVIEPSQAGPLTQEWLPDDSLDVFGGLAPVSESPEIQLRPVNGHGLEPVADRTVEEEPEIEARGVDGRTREAGASPSAGMLGGSPTIWAIAQKTWIAREPRPGSGHIGYLRFGAVVRREPVPAAMGDCRGGWFRVFPEGYLCNNGRSATTDAAHPLRAVPVAQADRDRVLPYRYVRAKTAGPTLFARFPDRAPTSNPRLARSLEDLVGVGVTDLFSRGVYDVLGLPRARNESEIRDTPPRSGFAVVERFENSGRWFLSTPDLELVDAAWVDAVAPSDFRGQSLDQNLTLPVAFAMNHHTRLYARDQTNGALRLIRTLGYREAEGITGVEQKVGALRLMETQRGEWLLADNLRVVSKRTNLPKVDDTTPWVDVSIGEQSLVAYEGHRPIYVTLVSTGVPREGESGSSTRQGEFVIQSKHVSATMASLDPEDPYEMREVPWVQYFSDDFALHGVYWHDGFGSPRSHGCVNLSPIDARFLFHFTNPGVPRAWHGVVAPGGQSSRVIVRP